MPCPIKSFLAGIGKRRKEGRKKKEGWGRWGKSGKIGRKGGNSYYNIYIYIYIYIYFFLFFIFVWKIIIPFFFSHQVCHFLGGGEGGGKNWLRI